MHSDQRQLGSKLSRPRVKPSRRMTSTRVFSGLRTSSGELWDFTANCVTATGVAIGVSSLGVHASMHRPGEALHLRLQQTNAQKGSEHRPSVTSPVRPLSCCSSPFSVI